MNVIWSKYVQGIATLYYSRKLRFDDRFAALYQSLFALDTRKKLRILEIGCGPGALAGALHRWYPNAEIVAIDRDSEFIRFAKLQEPEIEFIEGDATALPFEDGTFDVTISNTVSEHIEPSKFYGEQYRVLKPNGICLVLSSRKGIQTEPSCFSYSAFEDTFWEKANRFDNTAQKYAVCQYPMSETQLPLAMQQYGFSAVTTGYATIDLTPDDPKYPAAMAYDMINATRYSALDAIESVYNTLPEHFSTQEITEMKRITNERFDLRLQEYILGKKYWETTLSIIMTVRGRKE